MQKVHAPEIGIVASPSSAVAVASSRQRMPSSTCAHADQRRALEREAEHLEVHDPEPPPELRGRAASSRRRAVSPAA